jgi:hypothetical protein
MDIAAAADAASPVLVLGHGAGAGSRHSWMQSTARELAGRGITTVTFDFPYLQAGRKVPDPGPVLEEAFASIWEEVARLFAGRLLFGGGKSMGGRIASQATAARRLQPGPAGLIYFGYPLHPPGRPAQRRDRHLGAIGCPMLFLHGTRDPFGSPDEMRQLTDPHDSWHLTLIDGGDHSLQRPRRQDHDGAALRHAWDVAARWMRDETVRRG